MSAALGTAGADLDSNPAAIALAAQHWTGRGDVAASTYNQHLAIRSSFYSYAVKRSMLPTNPIALVERRQCKHMPKLGRSLPLK